MAAKEDTSSSRAKTKRRSLLLERPWPETTGKVVVDNPPMYESQSSGIVEEAGNIRECVLRFKDVIETKAKMKIDGSMALAPWMIRWAAMNVSRFQVGTDGMTAYERRRGRTCRVPMVCFGEKVWYKGRYKPKDQQKSEPKMG